MARTTLTRVGEAMADAVDEQPIGAVWAAQIAEQDDPEPEQDVDGWHTVTITSETSDASDAIAERISELQGDVDDPPMPREADPRSAIVDILRRRLEAVLQPVVMPIVGCGNPWHYATRSLGDGSLPAEPDAGQADEVARLDDVRRLVENATFFTTAEARDFRDYVLAGIAGIASPGHDDTCGGAE